MRANLLVVYWTGVHKRNSCTTWSLEGKHVHISPMEGPEAWRLSEKFPLRRVKDIVLVPDRRSRLLSNRLYIPYRLASTEAQQRRQSRFSHENTVAILSDLLLVT
jgi:hypothetical protein